MVSAPMDTTFKETELGLIVCPLFTAPLYFTISIDNKP